MKRVRPKQSAPAKTSQQMSERAAAKAYAKGVDAQKAGKAAEALAAFRTCTGIDRHHADAWLGLGNAFRDQGDLGEAENAYRTAIALRPAAAMGFCGLADVCLRRGQFDLALDHCGKAIILGRPAPVILPYLIAARAHGEAGRYDDALAMLTHAARIGPGNPDIHFEMGLIFEDQGKAAAAFEAYRAVVAHRPRDVRAYNNMASALVSLGQFDLAVATARMATALAPDLPDVYLNLATALKLKGDNAGATKIYEKIVELQPGHGEALVELCHRRAHSCDWSSRAVQQERAWENSYRQGRVVSPFIVMTANGSALEQLRCARVWGARLAKLGGPPLAPYAPSPQRKSGAKIRLGYLSADFHRHATAMLIADLLEQHDRSQFELYAYSLGPDDGSALRHRLVAAFDHFIDLRPVSDAEAARLIHAGEIDILLDLKGYTQEARVKILACRPAPVQINYLGFPGSMGAPFIDYIIADPIVAPMEHQGHFDERIVQLPHCYQPNDRMRARPDPALGRSEFGLPPDGFVFCSFNSPYKITPPVFDIWMRLLGSKPGSVLWLLAPGGEAVANLRREAAARGINPSRLVFAPFVTPEAHMARLGLADLFLDTTPVNAHTTASEALWAGLPLVTCPGETFASRVAASLVHAAGLPELAAPSLEAYEILARTLAGDSIRLGAIRERLQENRLRSPLFDTPQYARDFEKALAHIHALRQSGTPPRAFAAGEAAE